VIERLVADAAAGAHRQALLVTGEPGIGKTRLLAALEDEVRQRGGRVLRGRAFETEGVRAYGAWIDALRSQPLGEAAAGLTADLSPLLPELDAGPPAASGDRNRLF